MNAENIASVILVVTGAIISLVFRYVPRAKAWYDAQANKGPLMLGIVVVVAGGYLGLSCTPYAARLGVALTCDQNGIFDLLRALFLLATGNQLTYLYTQNTGQG